MKTLDVYWHIYPRAQIKPGFRGHLICVLEVPPVPGFPVLRSVLDTTDREFPIAGREALATMLEGRHHGLVFAGVCKSAILELITLDPVIREERPRFASYNRELVHNARHFLLADTDRVLKGLPKNTARLLRGELPFFDLPPVHS